MTIISENHLIKNYASLGRKVVSVDVTEIVDWFMNEDKKDVYDIYSSVDFPTLMNPFQTAIWKVKPFKNNTKPFYFLSETQKDDNGIYWTSYLLFFERIHSDFLFSVVTLACNKFGQGIKTNNNDIVPVVVKDTFISNSIKDKFGMKILQEMAQDLTLLRSILHAINLIHCKNIELVDEPLTRQQRRLKERKSKTIYKVLAIKEGDKSYRYLDHGHDGSKKALHLCRGHFRTYTDDAPLFGRVTGTFWIPAHVKGNKQYGEVVKDYKVIPATGD